MDFYVGEYVRLVDGRDGYIAEIEQLNDRKGKSFTRVIVKILSPKCGEPHCAFINLDENDTAEKNFLQIGVRLFSNHKIDPVDLDPAIRREFRIGDYVQTRDGRTGYIVDVLLWTAIKCVFTHKNGKELDQPETECFVDTKDEVLREKFKKIGPYDFESPHRKIEPIKLNDELINAVEFLLYKKANELTDAVNKINEQLAKER